MQKKWLVEIGAGLLVVLLVFLVGVTSSGFFSSEKTQIDTVSQFSKQTTASSDLITGNIVRGQRCTSEGGNQCDQGLYCAYDAAGGRDVCASALENYAVCDPTRGENQCAQGIGLRNSHGFCGFVQAGTVLTGAGGTGSQTVPARGSYYCLPILNSYTTPEFRGLNTNTNSPSWLRCNVDEQCRSGICLRVGSSSSSIHACILPAGNTQPCVDHRQCRSANCQSGICQATTPPSIQLQASSATAALSQRVTVRSNEVVSIQVTVNGADNGQSCVARSEPTNLQWNSAFQGSGAHCVTNGRLVTTIYFDRGVPSATTFSLECTKTYANWPSVPTSRGVTINVVDPPVITFTPASVSVPSNQQVTLNWNVESNARAACVGTEGMNSVTGQAWSEVRASAGSFVITPLASVNFGLSCTNTAGQTVSNVPVAVFQSTFTASTLSLLQGSSSVLTWNGANPIASCSLLSHASPYSGSALVQSVALSGSRTVTPSVTTRYTFRCSNMNDIQRIIEVIPYPLFTTTNFRANPSTLNPGQCSTLTWNIPNADSCTGTSPASGVADSFGHSWRASLPTNTIFDVCPRTTTAYVLACTGPGGTRTASRIITVVRQPPNLASFVADRTTINLGERVSFRWNIFGASSCVGSGPSGVNALSTGGSNWNGPLSSSSAGIAFIPLGTTTYRLTCTNSIGTNFKDIPVTVVQPTYVGISSFESDLSTISSGQSVRLTWSSTGATSCTGSGSGNSLWDSSKLISSTGFTVAPTTTTSYTLQCSNANGARSSPRTRTITVTSPITINQFSFTLTNPNYQSAIIGNLIWSTTGATSCRLVSSSLNEATSIQGNRQITQYDSTPISYTLTCQDSSGASVSRTVVV